KLNEEANKYRFDYGIPQVTVDQLEGILKVVDLMNERLGIDKIIIRSIFFQFMIEEQQNLERYHFEMEKDLAITRYASKKNLETKFNEIIYEILEDKNDMKIVNQTLEQMFEWYMKKYLKDK
ncbi:MAG: hypothetical protein ACXAC2_25995, partial [Candidatus Kariarchaeaceae archaeon]